MTESSFISLFIRFFSSCGNQVSNGRVIALHSQIGLLEDQYAAQNQLRKEDEQILIEKQSMIEKLYQVREC